MNEKISKGSKFSFELIGSVQITSRAGGVYIIPKICIVGAAFGDQVFSRKKRTRHGYLALESSGVYI